MTSQNLISLPDIQNLLSLLDITVKSYSMMSLERQLVAARDLLLEDPPIDVAVLGQFKAGKSSFSNSFLGQAVLPVGAIPIITAVTRLQYGASERALVRHFNGRITEVPLADVAAFTSEAKNPGNEKNVADTHL